MGAKISKRGSYSLSKREKKKKKSKISNLEERTPSVICLSQAQIYDDVLKSPDLSTAHKIPEFVSEDPRVNAADSNKTGNKPGPSVSSKPSSDHEIYSSVEELYANVLIGHGSENEEQMERKVSGAKGTSQAQETKPRKTWERPQYGNDDEFFDVLEGISDISSSEAGEMTDENPSNVNTGKWNGVFKGEFWSDKTQNMEVDVDYEEIDKIIKVKEEQLEIARQHEENTKEKLEEHIVLAKTTEENIDVNNTYVNAINGIELLEKTTDEEQVPIIDAMNNQLVETYDQTNVTDDQTHLSKTENKNEENEWVLLDPDNKNKINENVLYDKNSHIIPADSIEKLRDLLQEQQNAKIDSSNNLQEIAEDEEEASEQVEIDKPTKTSNMYIKQPQKVTFETRKNSSEDQMEVEQVNYKHRTLSKSSSVNSDMFYELADEGSEQEDTENEDQDLFYDAEGYDNAADIQVEVKNENIALSNKIETVSQVNAKENQIQIPIPQNNQAESFPAVETTKNKIVVEEDFLHSDRNNSGTTSESHTEGVGILIDLDEDLQKPPVQEKTVIITTTDNSEQIEFVELEGTVNDGVLLPINIEDQKKPVPLELNAAIIEQAKLIDQNADRNNSGTTNEGDTEDVGILIDPDEDLQKPPVQEKTVITTPTDNSEQIEFVELELVNNGVLLNIEDQKRSVSLEQNAAIIDRAKLIDVPIRFEDSNAFEEVSTNLAINLPRRLSDNKVANISEDINPAVEISGNSLQFVPEKNQFDQNISMEILKEEKTTNLANISNVQVFSEEPSQMHNASRPSTPNLTKSSTNLYENEINLEESLNGELVSNKEETFIHFADAKEHSASTNPFLNVNLVNSSKSSVEELVGNFVSPEPTNLPIIKIDEDQEASKKPLLIETEAVAEKENKSSPTIELAKAETEDVTTNSLENAAVEDSYSIFKPMTLSLLSNYQPITEDSSENEFKVPSAINSPEEIAEEQMRQWGQQKQVENEIIVSEINAIMVNIGSLKVKIENLGSTEKDREIHAAMYQEVIKIMREVNGINNHNFNEKILEMQRSALNQIHECLGELSLRRFN